MKHYGEVCLKTPSRRQEVGPAFGDNPGLATIGFGVNWKESPAVFEVKGQRVAPRSSDDVIR
jgi:hypothetical protein